MYARHQRSEGTFEGYPARPTEDPVDDLTEKSTDTSSTSEFGVYHFDLGLQTVQTDRSGTNLYGEVLINHSKFETTIAFFEKMAPVIQSIGALFECVSPEDYAQYKASYHNIAARSILRALYTTRRACWQAMTALINVTHPPDMNIKDCVHRDGWAAQTCFGEFTGGALQVADLGIQFEFQSGDVVFFRPALVECTVADFIGERLGLVLYNHKNVQKLKVLNIDTADARARGRDQR